jgi:hypothetical protein
MDTSELLRRAWEAVQESGIPEPFQQAALQAAVEDLRAQEGGESSSSTRDGKKSGGSSKSRSKGGTTKTATEETPPTVDEGTFFKTLEHESGVPEKDLRDVLRLTGATVTITPATKDLGDSVAEQARAVIVLVGGARSRGLGEDPVDLGAVRAEAKRKRCFQQNNFSTGHLGELKGFNRGPNRDELILGSKWVGEFVAAVNRALGRPIQDKS